MWNVLDFDSWGTVLFPWSYIFSFIPLCRIVLISMMVKMFIKIIKDTNVPVLFVKPIRNIQRPRVSIRCNLNQLLCNRNPQRLQLKLVVRHESQFVPSAPQRICEAMFGIWRWKISQVTCLFRRSQHIALMAGDFLLRITRHCANSVDLWVHLMS